MPSAPSKPCRFPGCRALVPSGYCAAHTRQASAVARTRDRHRGSAASRGYDSSWRDMARGFLSRFPLCPGVLIPTEHWTPMLAMEFHDLRCREQEAGRLLIFSHKETKLTKGVESVRRDGGTPVSAPARHTFTESSQDESQTRRLGQLARQSSAPCDDSEPTHHPAFVPFVSLCEKFLSDHPIYRIEPWDVGRAATVVDHIVPHRGDAELLLGEWNWQPLTARSHNRKTAVADRRTDRKP